MKYLLSILLFSLVLLGCENENEVNCSGTPSIQDLLINYGASDLADDLQINRATSGAVIELNHAASFDHRSIRMGGRYFDNYQTNNPAERSGMVRVAGVDAMYWKDEFQIYTLKQDSTLLSMFTGNTYNLEQYALNPSSTLLNSVQVVLPKAFRNGSNVASISKGDQGLSMTWEAENTGGFVYFVGYATNAMDDANSAISETAPFYIVKKLPDNGSATLSFSDFAALPSGAMMQMYLLRYSHKLYPDSRNAQRKNLFFSISSCAFHTWKNW